MSVMRGCAWILLAAGLVLPGGVQSAPADPKNLHKMIVYPTEGETVAQLKAKGIAAVEDYGPYWVVQVTDAQAAGLAKSFGSRAQKADHFNRIELHNATIDVTAGEPAIPAYLREQAAGNKRTCHRHGDRVVVDHDYRNHRR